MFTSERIGYRWVIAIVLFAAYSVQYLDRVQASVLTPAIAHDLHLTTGDIGTGTFLMLLLYGPSQYVSGLLTDKFGAKRVLVFSVLAWSVMTLFMGLIHSRAEYLWRMGVFGILVGTEYVPSARVLMRWFNKEGRARAQTMLAWAWIVTPAWASVAGTQLAKHANSWRVVFAVTGALGIVPLVLIAKFVFDRPEQYKRATEEDLEYAYRDELREGTLTKNDYRQSQQVILKSASVSFLQLLENRSYLAVIWIDIAMQVVLYGALVWIPLYLSDHFGFKLQTMGWWSALYFTAGAIGSFISSYCSDKVFHGNRKIMILTCFVGLVPFLVLLSTLGSASHSLLAFALCGMGFFGNMAWGPFLALPAEIFSPEVYGKAMGLANGIGYIAAAFSAKIFASLVSADALGHRDYAHGWLFIALCVATGIVAASLLKAQPISNRIARA